MPRTSVLATLLVAVACSSADPTANAPTVSATIVGSDDRTAYVSVQVSLVNQRTTPVFVSQCLTIERFSVVRWMPDPYQRTGCISVPPEQIDAGASTIRNVELTRWELPADGPDSYRLRFVFYAGDDASYEPPNEVRVVTGEITLTR